MARPCSLGALGKGVGTNTWSAVALIIALVLRAWLVAGGSGLFILPLPDRLEAITQRPALFTGIASTGSRLPPFRLEPNDAGLDARRAGHPSASSSSLP